MAGVIDTSEFRKGLKIEIDGEPFEIVEFQHVKPGKGSAFVRTTIRSLITRPRAAADVQVAATRWAGPTSKRRRCSTSTCRATTTTSWTRKNYEQTFLSEKVLGEAKNFLKENINASVLFYNGKAIGVTLPNSVDLKVTKCDPGVRGDTVSGALKPATLETGYTRQRAALHQRGRRPEDRHARRQVPHPRGHRGLVEQAWPEGTQWRRSARQRRAALVRDGRWQWRAPGRPWTWTRSGRSWRCSRPRM